MSCLAQTCTRSRLILQIASRKGGACRNAVKGLGRCNWSRSLSSEPSGLSELPPASGSPQSALPYLQDHEATLYVHWPYCERRCSYCNFNKYVSRSVDHARMRKCLVRELESLLLASGVTTISSVFVGGGTPSLAEPQTLAAVLEAASRLALVPAGAEVSMEANPCSAATQRLVDFRAAGVNRISLGLQALSDADLKTLGRDHTAEEGVQALATASAVFPGHVSADLMFGRPGQHPDSWEQELRALLGSASTLGHVSLYQLTLERGTELFARAARGEPLALPDADACAEMYNTAREILSQAGLHQYEVSNFAREGAASVHNQSYWLGKPYIGVGPGAHGRFVARGEGAAEREARVQTLEPEYWMREVERHGHGTRRRKPLSPPEVLEEVLVMGLRMNRGITHERWARFSGDVGLHEALASPEVQRFQDEGLLMLDESYFNERSVGGGYARYDCGPPPPFSRLIFTEIAIDVLTIKLLWVVLSWRPMGLGFPQRGWIAQLYAPLLIR
uniref:Radical S-adenosyl methionine domain-containing protein n=1 Tax=Petromyzon marinus TaxID=7757 RepID=A0AAJ7X6B5_PETMA|nr:radical S-adenosyl methionine domain-containing protein 1, mitochondrial isoform X2 [Petromyzon marinus]